MRPPAPTRLRICAILADESIGGLFSAKVVEHLEADYLMQVLGDA